DGNLVATPAEVSHVQEITDAVTKILEIKPGTDVRDPNTIQWKKAGDKGYRDFHESGDIKLNDGEMWFTERNGEILISDALWTALESKLGNGVKRGEIQQALRALRAVG